MNRALLFLCGTLLTLGACDDNGGTLAPPPPADLVVHLSAAPAQVTVQPGAGGGIVLTCTYTIIALATGDAAARAEWTGGMVRYYAGFSTEPVSSGVLSASQLTEVFGGPFSPNLNGTAQMTVVANTAFTLEMEVSYRVQNNDARRTATTRSTCSPPAGTS
jgi:hypothetical protein